MDRGELEDLDRESLVVRAQAAGIRRARILTRPELIDELLRLDPNADAAQLKKSRGFFGRARDLVARVVERGLHLPDAADRIRAVADRALGTTVATSAVPRTEPQAMPTVTLAEIYAAQGHRQRAIETLRRVLEREPDHAAARALLARLEDAAYVPPQPKLPLEPEVEPELDAAPEDEAEDEAVTIETAIAAAPARAPIQGPSDSNGESEFSLLPASDTVEASEIEECFAIPVTSEGARDAGPEGASARMFVRWSVSWSTIGALLGARPNGRFVVRAHVVTPTWDGPNAETRDLVVDPDDEQVMLVGLPEPSVVRVAVGWLDRDAPEDRSTFVPIAHSPALELSRGRGLVIWTTSGVIPVVLDDPRAASIARALAASQVAAQAHP